MKTVTAQEVFDTVARHLLRQGRRAVNCRGDEQKCSYRAENGDQCAVGCLIPRRAYVPEMEEVGSAGLLFVFCSERGQTWHVPYLPHLDLLEDLQHLHDTLYPFAWQERLGDIAKLYGLKMPVPFPDPFDGEP